MAQVTYRGVKYDTNRPRTSMNNDKKTLVYRGVHYAKWVYLNIFPNDEWELKNPREEG